MYYIHKHEVALQYGGSEEGGWWYDTGEPCEDWIPLGPYTTEDAAIEQCRALNEREHERGKSEDYEYSSVLSYKSNHYGYSVHETTVMAPYPERRPHYE